MNCIRCGSSKSFVFLTEKIPCTCCNNYTDLCYYSCESCGNIWRVVDGKPLEEGFMSHSMEEVRELNLSETTLEELQKAIEAAEKEAEEIPVNTMSDMLHRCLRCENIAYEVSNRCFKCPKCGFEWEVI